MYTNSDFVKITDAAEELAKDICQSEIARDYLAKSEKLRTCADAQNLIIKFNKAKEKYEEAKRFGKYYPNYNDVVKEMRLTKREMDFHPEIAAFKKSEAVLLQLLSEISEVISSSVSDKIKVPSAVPFSNNKSCSCKNGRCGCS